jgi:TetR/AcrR family transcriptional regulator
MDNEKQARRQSKKDDKKGYILSVAEDIMTDKGINGLNMDLVAKETNFAKGTLYLYFKSKEEILAQLTIKARHLLLKKFKQSIKGIPNEVEQLKAVLWANFYFCQRNKLYYELLSFYEVNNNLTETVELKESIFGLASFITQIVEDGKKKELIKTTANAQDLVYILWATNVGMMQLISVRGNALKKDFGIQPKVIYTSYINTIIDGLAKQIAQN